MTREKARKLVIRALCSIRCEGLRNDYSLRRLRLNAEKSLRFINEFFRDVDESQYFVIINQEGQIVDRAGNRILTLGDLVSLAEKLD